MTTKQKQLQLSQQLASVPIRNEGVRAFPGDDGESLVVEVALQHSPWLRLLRPLVKLRDRASFRLDGIGLAVYESIDGKRTFSEYIDEFAARHKLTFFEGRALLMQYMDTLMKKGLIVIGIRDA